MPITTPAQYAIAIPPTIHLFNLTAPTTPMALTKIHRTRVTVTTQKVELIYRASLDALVWSSSYGIDKMTNIAERNNMRIVIRIPIFTKLTTITARRTSQHPPQHLCPRFAPGDKREAPALSFRNKPSGSWPTTTTGVARWYFASVVSVGLVLISVDALALTDDNDRETNMIPVVSWTRTGVR